MKKKNNNVYLISLQWYMKLILFSTRGTADSDIWFMCLADKPMVRGYHLTDYD